VHAPAVCICYWTPHSHVNQLPIFISAKKKVVRDGKQMLSEIKQIALITSHDDTVATFRFKLAALFSGKAPNQVSTFNNEGMPVKMEDSLPLKHYHLLCFQTISARFLSFDARKDALSSIISHTVADDDEPSSLPHPDNQHAAHSPARAIVSADSDNIRRCTGMFSKFQSLQLWFVFVASTFIKFTLHVRVQSAVLSSKLQQLSGRALLHSVIVSLIASEMQWLRGAGQSHCFSCCGRHVKIVEFDSQTAADVVSKPPPSLHDFIMRITAMDAAEPYGVEVDAKTKWAACKPTVDITCLFDTESDDCIDAANHLSECDSVDWNARLRCHYLKKVKIAVLLTSFIATFFLLHHKCQLCCSGLHCSRLLQWLVRPSAHPIYLSLLWSPSCSCALWAIFPSVLVIVKMMQKKTAHL
jgi:hypothetical protein